MDLISRQVAIDAMIEDKIQTKIYITPTAERDFEVFNGACDRHAKILKELPSAQPIIEEPHWIPCSERLPEKEGWYFVTVHPDYIVPDSMHTDLLYWLNEKWWFYDYDARMVVWPDPIIAWMLLPEPYEER